jgi:hypothetical protein
VEKAKRLPSRAKTHPCKESSVLLLLKPLQTLGFDRLLGHVSRRQAWANFKEDVSKMLHVVAFAPDRSGAEIGKSQAKAKALFAF